MSFMQEQYMVAYDQRGTRTKMVPRFGRRGIGGQEAPEDP